MVKLDERKQNILSLIIALLIPQAVGGVAAIATNSSMNGWYQRLKKPSFNPPAPVFPIAWTSLYLMMGAASWLVFRRGQQGEQRQAKSSLGLYGVQLGFNLMWSVLFFGLRRMDLALGELVILWGLILATLTRFFRHDRRAGWLLVPYQLWTTFAGVLNATIWWMNRDKQG